MRRSASFYSRLAASGAAAIGAGTLLGFATGRDAQSTLAFSGLLLASVVIACASPRQSLEDWAVMRPAFVVDATSLWLFGPHATVLVVLAGRLAPALVDSAGAQATGRALVSAAIAAAAIEGAGFVHQLLGGTLGSFAWPSQAVPVAAAVLAYSLITSVAVDLLFPLATRRAVNRLWGSRLLQGAPHHLVGASLAIGLAALVGARMWELGLVVAVPLYFAWRGYRDYVTRVEDEHRRREVIQSLDEGLCGVDSDGRVTAWSDTLERMLDCSRRRALSSRLLDTVPALADTALPTAIAEVMSGRKPRTTQVGLGSGPGARVLHVDVLPVPSGATLIWHDATDRARTEQALKRSEERFALAAEGANDGMWEWDLRSQDLYVSSRWRAMLGLAPETPIARPDDWFEYVHPEDVGSLKDAIEAHLSGKSDHVRHEHRVRHSDGSYRRVLCRAVASKATTAGRRPARLAGSLTDTTEASAAQERMRSAGSLDPLTGLCNRAVFVEELGQQLDDLKQRRRGERFAVLYLDLDRFKVVNDSLGHLVGDELLTAVSRRLESCLRPGDTIARLGGDEFAILLNGLAEGQQANAIAFRIQGALAAPFSIGGREVFTTASIGIAFGPAQYTNPDEIMRDADTAMYHAKSRGKARHELFDADMHARARDRLALENDLRRAVNTDDFEVHYQPIVHLASGRCVGFESLIRWTRNGKAVSPAAFIPIAEELGLIERIGTWVLQQACLTFSEWQRRFPAAGLDFITVNVSSRQLGQQNFLRLVEQAVEKSKLEPQDLRLEITETALMDNPGAAAALLHELRDFGVKIYLDDFGTGYSSLSHLHKLPVDTLKIDRSFVKSLGLEDRPKTVETILGMAKTLNTSVVAEGVETELQAHVLERLGCTHAQGYLFSRPLSSTAVEEILLVGNQPLGPKQGPALSAAT